MSAIATNFSQRLAKGKVGESLIASWLLARGNAILPVYEVELDTGKGPRLFTPEEKLIAPDMIALTPKNGVCWIEAKHKTVFSWYRKKSQWETGIDLCHYEDYLAISDRYHLEVWLMFLHRNSEPDCRDKGHCIGLSPTGLFAGNIAKLREHESHRSDLHGRTGMVYWAHETLSQLATLEEIEAASSSAPVTLSP